jgi:hypothetical protein
MREEEMLTQDQLQKSETLKSSLDRTSGTCNTYIQILGTVTGDSCPSIMIVTESARYLFNAGDGLQVHLFRVFLFTMQLFILVTNDRGSVTSIKSSLGGCPIFFLLNFMRTPSVGY